MLTIYSQRILAEQLTYSYSISTYVGDDESIRNTQINTRNEFSTGIWHKISETKYKEPMAKYGTIWGLGICKHRTNQRTIIETTRDRSKDALTVAVGKVKFVKD